MLDKRLKACADFVRGKRPCDVGTDHAYLIAELLSGGKCDTAIAADINEKPLEAAKRTLAEAGVLSRAEVILSDGLKNVPEDGITDIVIAGMGGELIAKILSECSWLEDKNLILQPMSKVPELIDFLCKNGFGITAQKAVTDGRFRYTVINAEKGCAPFAPTEIFRVLGKLDMTDPDAKEYAEHQAERLFSEGRAAKWADKIRLAAEIMRTTGGKPMYTVQDIFTLMDSIAPFKNTQKGDNSGLLAGNADTEVTKVICALDISRDVVEEAKEKGANVIISHHPVIFNPLYTLDENNPACLAFRYGIACICFHSPLDIAKGGINDIMFDMMTPALKLKKLDVQEPVTEDGLGYGWVCSVGAEIMPDELAKLLKDIYGCTVVRYNDTKKPIKKLAFCSGGAGGELPLAIKAGADAYITGDVKHNQFIEARNNGVALYDCGHFHTEDIVVPYIIKRFGEAYPDLEIFRAESDRDPADYVL